MVLVMLVLVGCLSAKTKIDIDDDIEESKGNVIILTEDRSAIMDSYAIPYPRLAMWWLDAYEESAESISRYDLLLNEMDSEELIEKIKEVRDLNEDIIILRPLSPSEHELYLDYGHGIEVNKAIQKLPTSFFLMHEGSFLADDITIDDTHLYVDKLYTEDGRPLFLVGDDISIGMDESATVIDIIEAENILVVERGYVRGLSEHYESERVQAHVRFWPGSWVMNITSACPEIQLKGVNEPVDYITYYNLLCQDQVKNLYDSIEDNPYYVNPKANYNGFIIDRFEDHQSWLSWVDDEERRLDPYLSGELLSDEEIDKLVIDTVNQFTSLLEETYNEPIIIRNNPITVRSEIHNGQVYESFGWDKPNTEWWNMLIGPKKNIVNYYEYQQISYLGWSNLKENPLVFLEVYEDEVGPDADGDGDYKNPLDNPFYKLNEQKMRYSLCTTLLGDGFYSYEVNTNGHGSLGLLWFDAYDLGKKEKGYLGYPIGDFREVDTDIYIREFERGVVIVNSSNKEYKYSFDKSVTEVNGFAPSSSLEAFDGGIYLYSEE